MTQDIDENKDFCQDGCSRDRTIFVSGLDYNTSENEITEFFSQCGEIELVKVPKYKQTDKNTGYCHITFVKREAWSKALELTGNFLKGRFLDIEKVKGPQNLPKFVDIEAIISQKVYVKNLPYDTVEEEVKCFFTTKAGEIKEMKMIYYNNGKFKGNAYVTFTHQNYVQKALQLSGHPFAGRFIKVFIVKPNPAVQTNQKLESKKNDVKSVCATSANFSAVDNVVLNLEMYNINPNKNFALNQNQQYQQSQKAQQHPQGCLCNFCYARYNQEYQHSNYYIPTQQQQQVQQQCQQQQQEQIHYFDYFPYDAYLPSEADKDYNAGYDNYLYPHHESQQKLTAPLQYEHLQIDTKALPETEQKIVDPPGLISPGIGFGSGTKQKTSKIYYFVKQIGRSKKTKRSHKDSTSLSSLDDDSKNKSFTSRGYVDKLIKKQEKVDEFNDLNMNGDFSMYDSTYQVLTHLWFD